MKRLGWILGLFLLCSFSVFGQGTQNPGGCAPAGSLTAGTIPKATGIPCKVGDSSITDNGTQVQTTEHLNAADVGTGTEPSAATNGTAAGGFDFTESVSTGWNPTAGEDYCRADQTLHVFKCSLNGAGEVTFPMLAGDLGGTSASPQVINLSHVTNGSLASSGLATTGVSGSACGDATHSCGLTFNLQGQLLNVTNNVISGGGGSSGAIATVSLAAQTGAITTTTLCSTGTCPSGQYHVNAYLNDDSSGVSVGVGVVGVTIGYTDNDSAVSYKLNLDGPSISSKNIPLGTTGDFGQATFNFMSAGSAAVTYATNYTGCTTGPCTYSLRLALYQDQTISGGSAPAYVQSSIHYAASGGFSVTTNFAGNVTASNTLYLVCADNGTGTTYTPSDVTGDTFVLTQNQATMQGNFHEAAVYQVTSAIGGAKDMTCNFGSSVFGEAAAIEISGAGGSPFDLGSIANGTTNPPTAGPITTTTADLVFAVGFGNSSTTSQTVGSGYTLGAQDSTTHDLIEYQVQGSAGAISATTVNANYGSGWGVTITGVK